MDQETTVADTTDTENDVLAEDHLAASSTDDGPVDELLIEEISIDGMCGVY